MNLKRLDKVFSEYIRRRDADENGFVKCCTCPTVKHWKQMDCGHFRKCGNLSTRWNERNAAVQCPICNRPNDGEYAKMQHYLILRFGVGTIFKVIERSHEEWKPMQFEIDELTEHFKNKIKCLE